jgi:polyhydroxybutyrate depolymerase
MVLHGAGGNAPRMEKYTGFSKLADQRGFAVVYPQASAPVWNITESRKATDDVGFIGTMLSDIEQTICVDSDRVYAAGVSNGGGMAALLGCALGDRIAAIAPVEGDYDDLPACRPAAPLSVLEIHGTADPIAPYFGHRGAASAQGVPPFVKSWIHREGCAVSASTRAIASRTLLYQWRGCAGVSVEHIRIRGGRHQWPGATPPDPGPPSTICGACTIWDFFSGLAPRPSSHSGGAGLPMA